MRTPSATVTDGRSALRGGQRGSVTVETAVCLAAVLTLALGLVQLGIVGFLQLTVDAASFLNAHQNVVGVTDVLGPADATAQVFPQVRPSMIATAVGAAPPPTVPVDYGYNGTSSEQSASATNRHGGASMLQPYLLSSTVTKPNVLSIAGIPITVSSSATEPDWLETGPLWNVSNLPYGSSSTNSQYRTNYFTAAENTPPYFMAEADMQHCNDRPMYWNATAGGTQCYFSSYSQNSYSTEALGMADFLDSYNWANPQPGTGGAAGSTGSGGTTGTFELMACHQRFYVTLAQFFAANPTLPPLESATSYAIAQRNYDRYNSSSNDTSYFANWSALNYVNSTAQPYVSPNATETGTSTSGMLAYSAYMAIRTIYSWDVIRQNTPPKNDQFPNQNTAYSLHPGSGCT